MISKAKKMNPDWFLVILPLGMARCGCPTVSLDASTQSLNANENDKNKSTPMPYQTEPESKDMAKVTPTDFVKRVVCKNPCVSFTFRIMTRAQYAIVCAR